MSRVVNVEILGRPVNVAIIVLMIVAFWFSIYMLKARGVLPTTSSDDN